MADLLALTAGLALAVSLDRYKVWLWGMMAFGLSDLSALTALLFWLAKGCEAFLPVILARRLRYGGPIRPPEFLAMTVGFTHLLWSFEESPILFELVNGGSIERWKLIQAAIGLLAAFLFAIRRRKPPAWASGLILVVAWHGLVVSGLMFLNQRYSGPILETLDSPWARRYVGIVALYGPLCAVIDLPLIDGLFDLAKPGRHRRTWEDWASLMMVAGYKAVDYVYVIILVFRSNGLDDWAWNLTSTVLQPIASLALALVIARRFGPAWRRWTGPDARVLASDPRTE